MIKKTIKKTLKRVFKISTNVPPPLPVIQRSDDIYLVSFPRSGNTWVSFLIANAINEHLNLQMNVNFFNIHSFIPDIHVSRDIPKNLEFKPFRRIIKSHAPRTNCYKNVIYLIRNPENVMASYFHFLTDLGENDKDISSFIRDEKYGIQTWINHTQGWLEQSSPSQKIHMFSYEKFTANAEKELQRLFILMGHNLSEETIKIAVEKSSLDNMKKLEKDTISLSVKKYDKFKFVRKGEALQGTELSEQDKKFIEQETGKILKNIFKGINNHTPTA